MKRCRPQYARPKGDPAKTLAIILIGACLMLAVDLFVLGGKDVIWPRRAAPGKTPEEISMLRDQHRRYLDEGLEALPPETVQAKFMGGKTLSESMPGLLAAESERPAFPYEEFYEEGGEPPEQIMPASGDESSEGQGFSDPYFKTEINYQELDLPQAAQPPQITTAATSEGIEQKPKTEGNRGLETLPVQKAEASPEPAPDQNLKKAAQATAAPLAAVQPAVRKGTVVIIIDDMGLTANSREVEKLPGPLTLAYLPYAQGLPEQTARARKRGHELMVHMPMQPMNGKVDGGPTLLKVDQDEKTFMDLLRYNLSQFDGYVGINNHMGSRLTRNRTAMNRVMKELRKRDLYFIDSKTIGNSVAASAAADAGLAYAERDIFLDHEITMPFIRAALKKVEWTARHKGYAIAIGHPHSETIRALAEWLPTLKDKGLTLRPASAVVRRKPETVLASAAPVKKPAAITQAVSQSERNEVETTQEPESESVASSPAFKVTEQGIIVLPQTPQPQAPQHE